MTSDILLQGISLQDLTRSILAALTPQAKPEQGIQLYNDKEVCRMLGISRSNLNDLVRQSELKRVKIGKSSRYLHTDIERFIADNTLTVPR